VFEHVCRMGLEGIVSKRTDAPYRSGPSKTWLRSKNPTSEAVIARDDGTPDFRTLRSRRRGSEAVLYAFDLIEQRRRPARPATDRPEVAAQEADRQGQELARHPVR